MYNDIPLSIRFNSTLRYFAVDGDGNRTKTVTEKYVFKCPEVKHAEKMSRYPKCRVSECEYGYVLKSNVCISRIGGIDPDDYRLNAVTAPRFSSSKPMTIKTKPSILITKQHRGLIPRPIIFIDPKRGTQIQFERDTLIKTADDKLFDGYILPPENRYIKDYPIHFGYTFKSIFHFADAEQQQLSFHPPIQITVPYTEGFNSSEGVTVFTYDEDKEKYSEYPEDLYRFDLKKQEVTIASDTTRTFFVAQTGKSFNKSVFQDTDRHWAKNHIEALYRRGIVKGRAKGIYDPDGVLNRAEFTKIALKAIDAEVESQDEIDSTPFRDVPLFAWYAPYVKRAHELGLIRGYDDGTFKPEQPINRAEAIKILMNAFEFQLSERGEASEEIDSKEAFQDILTDQWYFPYVDFAIKNKLLGGIRLRNDKILDSFGPGRSVSRGEMAKLAIATIELKEELDKRK